MITHHPAAGAGSHPGSKPEVPTRPNPNKPLRAGTPSTPPPLPPTPLPRPPGGPRQDHIEVAGWQAGRGECGVQCGCGEVFDGFSSVAEAQTELAHHAAAASPARGTATLAAVVLLSAVAAGLAMTGGRHRAADQSDRDADLHRRNHLGRHEQTTFNTAHGTVPASDILARLAAERDNR